MIAAKRLAGCFTWPLTRLLSKLSAALVLTDKCQKASTSQFNNPKPPQQTEAETKNVRTF